jgi:hypothetical protein
MFLGCHRRNVQLGGEATRVNSMNSSKTRYEVTLSQEAWAGVETVAQKFNLSVSEFFERIGHGRFAIVDPEEVEDLEEYLDLHEELVVEADSA